MGSLLTYFISVKLTCITCLGDPLPLESRRRLWMSPSLNKSENADSRLYFLVSKFVSCPPDPTINSETTIPNFHVFFLPILVCLFVIICLSDWLRNS